MLWFSSEAVNPGGGGTQASERTINKPTRSSQSADLEKPGAGWAVTITDALERPKLPAADYVCFTLASLPSLKRPAIQFVPANRPAFPAG